MEVPTNYGWLLLLLLMGVTLAEVTPPLRSGKEFQKDNKTAHEAVTSPPSTDEPREEQTTDRVIEGDLSKSARVESMAHKRTPEDQYDVIDVLASTSAVVGKAKTGQTTRIFTTGDVDENFWLKHLGEDFKHAIHLQVGGTNDDYNRLINQTRDGVHEEVHHEYLPGAERPNEQASNQVGIGLPAPRPKTGYRQPNLVTQLSLDGEALGLKQRFLQQQQQRYQQQPQYSTHSYTPTSTHIHPHIPYTHTQRISRVKPSPRLHYSRPSTAIISSSEDTLHAATTQTQPLSAAPTSTSPSSENDSDSFGSQLPFKSPFNDYGSRPTRDLTYLLYKRGL